MVKNESHIIFKGKDMGPSSPSEGVAVSGDNIIFTLSKLDNQSKIYKTYIVYNGKIIGEGTRPSVSGDHYAYVAKDLERSVVNFNGRELKIYKTHIIYDGKDIGEGSAPVLSRDHIAYCRLADFIDEQTPPNGPRISRYVNHLIYDGKDLGDGCENVKLSGDNVAFEKTSGLNRYIIYNGKDLGEGHWVMLEGNHVIYGKRIVPGTMDQIFYDGKDLGAGADVSVSGDNIAFQRDTYTGIIGHGVSSHIIYNGKDIAEEAVSPRISGNNLAYFKIISGHPSSSDCVTHLIYNGKDLGESLCSGLNMNLSGNDIMFQRKAGDGSTHVIYNGQDLGEGRVLYYSYSN